jgi:hypothetical protein
MLIETAATEPSFPLPPTVQTLSRERISTGSIGYS